LRLTFFDGDKALFSEVRADLRLADDPSAIRSTPLFPL
jgi:hypothetical protein